MARPRMCRGCRKELKVTQDRIYLLEKPKDKYHVHCFPTKRARKLAATRKMKAKYQAKVERYQQRLKNLAALKRKTQAKPPKQVKTQDEKPEIVTMEQLVAPKPPIIRKGAAFQPKAPSPVAHLVTQPGRIVARA